MSIVLQSKRNQEFVKTLAGSWTALGEQAHQFPTAFYALMFCFHHHLHNMQIVARFNDPAMNFTIPIADVDGRPPNVRTNPRWLKPFVET